MLIALADEAGSKLNNNVRPDADMIKTVLEHKWFDPSITESYAEEVGSNSIIVLVINGDQYRAMLRRLHSGAQMPEGWMMDFVNVIDKVKKTKGWIATFGNKPCLTHSTVPILLGKDVAIKSVCGKTYVVPTDKTDEEGSEYSDNESDSDFEDSM